MKLLGSAAIVLAALTIAGCASTGTPEVELVGGSTMTVSPASVDPADYEIQGLGDEGVSFISADGNIACGIESTAEFGDFYGCYITDYTYTDPTRPEGTQVPCGHGFQSRNGEAPELLCSGEPAPFAGVKEFGNPDVKVLESGFQIEHNEITCAVTRVVDVENTTESDVVTCENENGGFELSKNSYELF